MKELTRHIEALLLDNDCVILPNFGGFITNRASARWVEEEHMFLPPYRTIGFNPQLKINDGLLVQSYMQTHDATFPEALKLVEKAIEKLSEFLYKEGVVELRGIGRLYRTYAGEYHFEPTEDGVLTPTLYGLSSVAAMPVEILAAQRKEEEKREKKEATETVATPATTTAAEKKDGERHHTIIIKLKRTWVANIAATAAAVAMFFLLSTPVDNTYIEEENYASLGSVSVFEQVKSKSLLTTLFEIPAEKPLEAKAEKESKTAVKAPKAEPKTAEPRVAEVQQPAVVDAPKPIVTEAPKAETKPVKVNTATQEAPKAAIAAKAPKAPKAEAKPVEATIAEAKPAEAKPVEVAPKAEIKPVGPKFNIIVASVTSESDADVAIKDFAEKGHAGAFLIKGGGRFRIALKAFDNEAEAYRVANELKKDELFKHAWVLKTKK